MQKKIFNAISGMVITAVVIFALVTCAVCYTIYVGKAESELNTAIKIAAQSQKTPEEYAELAESELDYSVRVTFIADDGTVTFDTASEAQGTHDNHADRPEFNEAMENGFGSQLRSSKTVGKRSYYAAVRQEGGVLRFSREIDSVYSIILSTTAVLIVIAGLIIILATVISMKISESIITPIKTLVCNIDVLTGQRGGKAETDKIIGEYEELEPVAAAVRRLSARLDRYIKRLKDERETINLITQNMVEGMILLDNEDRVLSVNKSALTMLSSAYSGGEGRDIRELTRCGELITLIGRTKEEPSVTGDFAVGGRQVRAFVNRTSDSEGTVILMIDITESFNAEEMRRCFSANVSHELKTPLTTISGFGEMMENGIVSDKADVVKYGGLIHRESARLLTLINDIIRLSELDESADNSPETKDIDVLSAAQEVCSMLSGKAEKSSVDLKCTGEHITITANEGMLSEIIYNLADNAIKYNTAGGYVNVRVGRENGKAVITVSDSGIGIPAEHQQHIFERFYRVDKSRSKQRGGTGLGLSIVKHIVNSMNGNIDLRSVPEQGTEIKVTLPPKK